MKKKIFRTITFILILAVTSCDTYLDVEPKSSINEEQIFESEEGFQQAINGVYSQIAAQSLYGDRLTLGFVSALAQNYAVNWNGAPYNETRALNYTSSEVVGHLSTIWSSAYTAIAGLNKIIENTEERREVLSAEAYIRIRGEALSLRALLHFDLLRLYGPEYVSGSATKAIPYKTVVDQYATIPSTTAGVVEKALSDLAESASLLKDDPGLSTHPVNTPRTKFNYYAAKGLEARIRLYAGDRAGAHAAAKEIVEAEVFTFVTPQQAGAAAGSRDRLYVNELLFSLRNRNMLDWVDNYFRFNINTAAKLTRSSADLDILFEQSTTDLRRLYLFEQDEGAIFPSKFWQTYAGLTGSSPTSPNRLDQLVPVIRFSEVYYILAETAGTASEGIDFLNEVRRRRGIDVVPIPNIDWETLEAEIRKEYQKEFYAEGQLFFYYKRKNIARMLFMNEDVPLSRYQLPIPDAEREYNPNY